jgi:hypothetical protein
MRIDGCYLHYKEDYTDFSAPPINGAKLGTLQCSVVGFEVLTAVSTKMAVFWVVAPCSLVEVYQRFRGPWCLHHQGDIATAIFYNALFQ